MILFALIAYCSLLNRHID